MICYLSCIGLLFSLLSNAASFEAQHTWQNDIVEISLEYNLAPQNAIFKNVHFSLNTPALKLLDYTTTQPTKLVYDNEHIQEQLGYIGQGKFVLHAKKISDQFPPSAQLFMHYQEKISNEPQEFVYTFSLPRQEKDQNKPQTITPKKNNTIQQQKSGLFQDIITAISNALAAIKNKISDLFLHTTSSILRLVLVFFLGLFMSLTPCIYPMIPVTIGILQTTARSSLIQNFFLASSYTLGIAFTFAILGFLAATGSAHFGSLLGNINFVCALVLFLAYLAGSMLGLYELHIPRFLQGGGAYKVNGSFFSAFLFGAISGSIASPCLSPGLVMLLSIVATMGNKWLGFLYLFLFGLGLGTPLLIIGTFSNALQLAPRAGLWMLEIKKIFGIMMLGMCCYYLNNVLDWHILLLIMSGISLMLGILFIGSIKSTIKRGMRWYKYIAGTLFIIGSILLAYQSFKATMTFFATQKTKHITYIQAREQAITENKLMILDFGAHWCSACSEIDHIFFKNKRVLEQLAAYIVVKIDCTNPTEGISSSLQEQFEVHGLPTILLIDPHTETIIARWSSEILSLSPDEFVEEIQQAH